MIKNEDFDRLDKSPRFVQRVALVLLLFLEVVYKK